ncbi:MAG: cyclase family protein [Bacilli bacterium]|jgi:arylformamidase|nr:cyclase family protein [Acholeplasmataceae bacterium]
MKIYDISMTISEKMPVYKNRDEKKPGLLPERKGHVYETRLEMNLHTGTHVDAPLHMLPDGKTVLDYPLEKFIAPCRVLAFPETRKIGAAELQTKQIEKGDFVLLKTANSESDVFEFDFAYLSADGAEYLKELGASGIGIDALGIERDQEGHPTHKILLGAGIPVLEGLRLKDVPEGRYLLLALPLKIEGAEAAPVRAVLVDKIFG